MHCLVQQQYIRRVRFCWQHGFLGDISISIQVDWRTTQHQDDWVKKQLWKTPRKNFSSSKSSIILKGRGTKEVFQFAYLLWAATQEYEHGCTGSV